MEEGLKKYRIGIVYDIAKQRSDGQTIGWAYYSRARALQKYAPDDMEIDIWQTAAEPWKTVHDKDLIFQIEYCHPSPNKYRSAGFKGVWVVSFNSDSRRRADYWPHVLRDAQFTIVNNYEAWNHYGRLNNTCCISNGYDPEVWHSEIPVTERPHKMLWCGSSGATKGKRYAETFQPLEELAPKYGFETDFRPINEICQSVVRTYDDQRAWYNSGSYILCASVSEGTPNYFGEGVLSGCVGVTVPVGNAQEWGVHGENCVFCEHRPQDFIEALAYARDNRKRLSENGMKTLHSQWTYGPPGNRDQYFYSLFRRLIEDGPKSVEPFSYNEKHWGEI